MQFSKWECFRLFHSLLYLIFLMTVFIEKHIKRENNKYEKKLKAFMFSSIFSALDVESEKAVQEALDYAIKGNYIVLNF